MNNIDKQYKVMNKEQQELVNEVYENYRNAFIEGHIHEELDKCLSVEEFIEEIKTDSEFSEKWGLKIEERELSLDERAKLHPNTEMFYNIHGTFSIQNSIEDSNFPDKDWLHEQFSRGNIPTKLITIT